MLTWDEEDYLSKLPPDKVVVIKPFDPIISQVSGKLTRQIREIVPNLEVRLMGASALQISGQNDIDIYILCAPEQFKKYLPKLVKTFGKVHGQKYDSIAWKFLRDKFEVEMYLSDPTSAPMKRQIAVFEKLKNNPPLLEEYRKLKESLNGKSVADYQREKYKFYHRILDE